MEWFCDWLLAQGGYAGWSQALRRHDDETNAWCSHTSTDKSTFIKSKGFIREIQSWRQLVEWISFLMFHGEEEVIVYVAVWYEHDSGHARVLSRIKPFFTSLIEEMEKILPSPDLSTEELLNPDFRYISIACITSMKCTAVLSPTPHSLWLI